jgi:hypothetical protein
MEEINVAHDLIAINPFTSQNLQASSNFATLVGFFPFLNKFYTMSQATKIYLPT